MAGEKQPIAVVTFDYLKKFSREATGVDAGRQASKNNKLLDTEGGKARLDIKGSAVFIAHNFAPMLTRTMQHPKFRKRESDSEELMAVATPLAMADFLVTCTTFISAGTLAASLKVDPAEAVGILAGVNTAKNAAIVLIPDAIHSIPGVLHSVRNLGRMIDNKLLTPHFKHRPNLSDNGTK